MLWESGNTEVSLAEVLHFREEKASVQLHMHEKEPDAVVVSLGMNIPGPVKCTPLIEEAFYEGVKELEEIIEGLGGDISEKEFFWGKAGYAAAYLVKGADGIRMKQEAIRLEESHLLGRIWDIDVTGKDGGTVSRERVGIQGRKCFLCGRDAKLCGRGQRHGIGELQDRVAEIILRWKTGEYIL